MGNFTPPVIPSWLRTMVMVIPDQLGAENWIPSDQKWLENPFIRNVIILLDISYVIHVSINVPGQYHVIRNIYRCVFPDDFAPFQTAQNRKPAPWCSPFWNSGLSQRVPRRARLRHHVDVAAGRDWTPYRPAPRKEYHGFHHGTTDAQIGNHMDLWWSLFRVLNFTQFGKNKGFLSMPSSSNSGKVGSDTVQFWPGMNHLFHDTPWGDQEKWQFNHYNKYTYMD